MGWKGYHRGAIHVGLIVELHNNKGACSGPCSG